MAMLVFRNGAGEPDVIMPICFAIEIEHGVPIARDAALDHFQADDLALRPACGLHGQQSIASDKIALVELEPAVEARLRAR